MICYPYCFAPSLLTKLTSVQHCLSQNTRCYVKEKKIWWDHHNASKTAWHICHVSNNALHNVSIMLSVALQYKVPRRLLWSGKRWLEGKWCCYTEINSVHKLLVRIMKHIYHPTRWKRYMQGSKCLPLLCCKISQCADYRVSCNCPELLQLSEGNEENHEILSGSPVKGEEIKNQTTWILRTNVDPHIVPLGEQYCSWLNNTAMHEIKIWMRPLWSRMDEKTYMGVLLISGISSLKATITEFRVTGNESMRTLKTTRNIANSSYWEKTKSSGGQAVQWPVTLLYVQQPKCWNVLMQPILSSDTIITTTVQNQ